jgi:predicted AAA+ superfamily ATPase
MELCTPDVSASANPEHPKFYYFDAGVFRAIRPRGPLDRPEEIDGAALETLVLQNVRAVLDWEIPGTDIYYWRTSSGLEVDFVLYGPSIFAAIEVKRKRVLTSKDLTGLSAFAEDYPEARRYVFFGGDRELEIGGNRVLPIEPALINLPLLLAKG